MPTGVHVYRWDQAGATQLQGGLGKLPDLMRACLVDGFGSQPPRGWTAPFSDTNRIMLRQAGGHRRYLRIRDNGTFENLDGNAVSWDARGAEEASGIDSMIDSFGEQTFLNGLTRPDHIGARWILVADDRTVHLFMNPVTKSYWYSWTFGQFYTRIPGDAYNDLIVSAPSLGGHTRSFIFTSGRADPVGAGNRGWVWAARHYNQTTKNVRLGQHVQGAGFQAAATLQNGVWTYPSTLFRPNNLTLFRIHLHAYQDIQEPRGWHRGLYWTPHITTDFAEFDTFSGDPTGALAGRTFMILKNMAHPDSTGGAEVLGAYIIETSDTWDTN